jgi:hypothetical protein
MMLHEIIEANETASNSILIECLIPYKKLLLAYYRELYYKSEPILMVTSVSNAAQYGRIVAAHEFTESICEYLKDWQCTEEDSEGFSEYETINFNSIPLSAL